MTPVRALAFILFSAAAISACVDELRYKTLFCGPGYVESGDLCVRDPSWAGFDGAATLPPWNRPAFDAGLPGGDGGVASPDAGRPATSTVTGADLGLTLENIQPGDLVAGPREIRWSVREGVTIARSILTVGGQPGDDKTGSSARGVLLLNSRNWVDNPYVIEVQVISDRNLSQQIQLPLILDNTPPRLTILGPLDKQKILPGKGRKLELNIQIEERHPGPLRVNIAAGKDKSVSREVALNQPPPDGLVQRTVEFSNEELGIDTFTQDSTAMSIGVFNEDRAGNQASVTAVYDVSVVRWRWVSEGRLVFAPRLASTTGEVFIVEEMPDGSLRISRLNPADGGVLKSFTLPGTHQSFFTATDGTVVVLGRVGGASVVTAASPDGKVLWNHTAPAGLELNSPVLDPKGDRLYLVQANRSSGGAVIQARALRDGAMLWEYPLGGTGFAPLYVIDDLIYCGVTSAEGWNTRLTGIGRDGRKRWEYEVPGPGGAGKAVSFGYSFVLNGNLFVWELDGRSGTSTRVDALNPQNGQRRFSVSGEGRIIPGFFGDPFALVLQYPGASNGMVRLQAFEPGDARKRFDLTLPREGQIAWAPSRYFYAAYGDGIDQYGMADGSKLWSKPLKGRLSFHGVDRTFLSEPASQVNRDVAISLMSGSGDLLWTYRARTGYFFASGLYGKNGEVYLAESDPLLTPIRLIALSPADGKEIWSLPLDGPFSVGWDGTIYRLTLDANGRMIGVDAITP
ncbi:MAG: hypothetical protein GMKNLPBB_02238 [Myxococcota bacterium]|nr:hypothetical protein [Myxococcota bacterium]